jgi:hypothetical protein
MWSRLEAIKPLFAEPRAAGEAFDAVIASYYRAVDEGRGGLFMAVCRGKVGAVVWLEGCWEVMGRRGGQEEGKTDVETVEGGGAVHAFPSNQQTRAAACMPCKQPCPCRFLRLSHTPSPRRLRASTLRTATRAASSSWASPSLLSRTPRCGLGSWKPCTFCVCV